MFKLYDTRHGNEKFSQPFFSDHGSSDQVLRALYQTPAHDFRGLWPLPATSVAQSGNTRCIESALTAGEKAYAAFIRPDFHGLGTQNNSIFTYHLGFFAEKWP